MSVPTDTLPAPVAAPGTDGSPIAPGEKFKAGTAGAVMVKGGIGAAAVFAIISLWLGSAHGDNWKRFLYSFTTAWTFVFSLVIGCLFFVIIHHLTRSRWSTVVRRIAEIATGAFPILGLVGLGFIIPVLAGNESLYYWTSSSAHNHELNHHLAAKLGWLSPGFFAIRYGIYIASFTLLATYFARKSREQDESGDPKLSEKMRIAAGPGVILFGLTTVFFGFDILMSFAPKWYSTIYSVTFFGGAMTGAYALLTLLCMYLQRTGRLVRTINAEHYHDLGKWLWAYTFFWMYTAFSQFMLYWYANLPEETAFYQHRMFGGWSTVTAILLLGHFAFPFVILMSRWTKRIAPALAAFAVWQLAFHWLDLYWNVMPNYSWGPAQMVDGKPFFAGPLSGDPMLHVVGFSPVDITLVIALVGVLIAAIGKNLKGNLIPTRDPMLPLSIHHENY